MIAIMESLNEALKKNMLNSSQAIKHLTEMKVGDKITNEKKNVLFIL